jgi:hypothetical protein
LTSPRGKYVLLKSSGINGTAVTTTYKFGFTGRGAAGTFPGKKGFDRSTG